MRVSWTAPTSGALVTGYHINYHEEDAKGGIISCDSIDVDASTTEHNITIVLTAGHSYNITVRALSQHLPSPAVGSPTVTLGKTTCLIVICIAIALNLFPSAPSTPTVTAAVSQSPTSLNLNWTQPEGEIIDSFEIVFSYQGPCDSFTHTSTITADGTTRQYTLTGLQEFSTYTVNITAANDGGRSAVTSHNVTTRADGRSYFSITAGTSLIILSFLDPNAAPQAVTASVTGPTTVFVSWERVNCIDRNSAITSFTVYYGPVGGTAVNASVSGTNHLAYTAVDLPPFTNYSIEVAAVNSDGGVGPFSPPIFVRTPDLASEWVM